MDYKQVSIENSKEDVFAMKTTGIVIDEVDADYAKCSLTVDERHLNAHGSVMGGVIFTLADFTFGVVANLNHVPTVTLSSNINFINVPRGPIIYAEARPIKDGRRIGFYEVIVTDSEGNLVANVSINGYKKI